MQNIALFEYYLSREYLYLEEGRGPAKDGFRITRERRAGPAASAREEKLSEMAGSQSLACGKWEVRSTNSYLHIILQFPNQLKLFRALDKIARFEIKSRKSR
jgi:hypothetical protein